MKISPTLAPRFAGIYRFKPLDKAARDAMTQNSETHPQPFNQMLIDYMAVAETFTFNEPPTQVPSVVLQLTSIDKKSDNDWYGFTNAHALDVLKLLNAEVPPMQKTSLVEDTSNALDTYVTEHQSEVRPLSIGLFSGGATSPKKNQKLH